MNQTTFNSVKERYDVIEEKIKFAEVVKPRLFDIQSWYEAGIDFASIEKQLGLNENELWFMAFYIKIKELKKIFFSEKYNVDKTIRTLFKKANGYYVMKEQLVPVTETIIEGKSKIIKTHYEVKRIREYVEPDASLIKFVLPNKKPNEYQIKGQEPTGQDDEYLKNIEKLWKGIEADAKNKA